jgi:3,4-dihydroxy-9,10-secoandrosta-1,3,5(10)-triene-9,17-dione 4,5-dioxygenase
MVLAINHNWRRMVKSEVAALGYVVITAKDLTAWREFAESVLGLQVGSQPAPSPELETLYLRLDERSWRIAVEHGVDGGIGALGFEVASRDDFENLKSRLAAAGVVVKDAPEVAAHRRVLQLFQAKDPNGVPLEFFYGARTEQANFVSPRNAQFVTGTQGLGHVVLLVPEPDDTYDFYINLLGFRVSDVITVGPLTTTFTSPNSRHHSLAFSGSMGMPVALQHIMLQVSDIDSVGRALDRVLDAGALQLSLGRHSNDHMLSFYCSSPSGLAIEYACGGREVDDTTHTIGYYDKISFWGHRLPDGSDPMQQIIDSMPAQPSVG